MIELEVTLCNAPSSTSSASLLTTTAGLTMVFANLNNREKDAFFSLLDELSLPLSLFDRYQI